MFSLVLVFATRALLTNLNPMVLKVITMQEVI